MSPLPIILVLTIQVGIGLYMGLNYLRGTRNKPMFIGAHFLLGAAALEIMALMLSRRMNPGIIEGRDVLVATAALIAAALLTGLAGVMLHKPMPRSARVAIYSHAAIGIGAAAALIAWLAVR